MKRELWDLVVHWLSQHSCLYVGLVQRDFKGGIPGRVTWQWSKLNKEDINTQETVKVKETRGCIEKKKINTDNHYRKNEKGDSQSKAIGFGKRKAFGQSKPVLTLYCCSSGFSKSRERVVIICLRGHLRKQRREWGQWSRDGRRVNKRYISEQVIPLVGSVGFI